MEKFTVHLIDCSLKLSIIFKAGFWNRILALPDLPDQYFLFFIYVLHEPFKYRYKSEICVILLFDVLCFVINENEI